MLQTIHQSPRSGSNIRCFHRASAKAQMEGEAQIERRGVCSLVGSRTLYSNHWYVHSLDCEPSGLRNLILPPDDSFLASGDADKEFSGELEGWSIRQLASKVMAWCKRLCMPENCHKRQLKSMRQRLLKVAGKLLPSQQRFLVIAEENAFQDCWSFAPQHLALPNPISP